MVAEVLVGRKRAGFRARAGIVCVGGQLLGHFGPHRVKFGRQIWPSLPVCERLAILFRQLCPPMAHWG